MESVQLVFLIVFVCWSSPCNFTWLLVEAMHRTRLYTIYILFYSVRVWCLQCFDTVGWATGRASSMWNPWVFQVFQVCSRPAGITVSTFWSNDEQHSSTNLFSSMACKAWMQEYLFVASCLESFLCTDCKLNYFIARWTQTVYGTCTLYQCFDAVGRTSSLWKTKWWGTGVVICLERGAECKWFAYGPADATVTPWSLAPVKSRMVYLSGAGLPRLSWKKGR